MLDDNYLTIVKQAKVVSKEKGSKFLAFAFPVEEEPQVKVFLEGLRKEYYDATHHCYAWRLGADGFSTRANDDSEPSNTAGKPILGQILSAQLTNVLIVVVRYFGRTKLGVSGLIAAYKGAAAEVIAECEVVGRTVDGYFDVEFSYMSMNSVMRVVKELDLRIVRQSFDNLCFMELATRRSNADILVDRLGKIEGVKVELKGYK